MNCVCTIYGLDFFLCVFSLSSHHTREVVVVKMEMMVKILSMFNTLLHFPLSLFFLPPTQLYKKNHNKRSIDV